MIDITTALEMILFIFISPALIVGTLIAWNLIFMIAYKIIGKFKEPHAPYSDIDPSCHPAFVRDSSGNAFIEGVKIHTFGGNAVKKEVIKAEGLGVRPDLIKKALDRHNSLRISRGMSETTIADAKET